MIEQEKKNFLTIENPSSFDGRKVKGTIHKKEFEGVLRFYENYFHICQNTHDGADCDNKYGYKYSYRIGYFNIGTWDFEFIEEFSNYKYGDIVFSKSIGKCQYVCAIPYTPCSHNYHLVVLGYNLRVVDDLIESEKTVRLNNSYDAIVNSEGITVGCQKFDFSALDRLVEVAKNFRE